MRTFFICRLVGLQEVPALAASCTDHMLSVSFISSKMCTIKLRDSRRHCLSVLKAATLFVTVRRASRQLSVQCFVLCFKKNGKKFGKPSWSPSHDSSQKFSGSRLGSLVYSQSVDLEGEVSRGHSGCRGFGQSQRGAALCRRPQIQGTRLPSCGQSAQAHPSNL